MGEVPGSFWRAVEAVHGVVYFGALDDTPYEAVGLRGFWRGYFASRAAALGTPGPELVIATFYGFAPEMVRRAVPEVWTIADRDAVLSARADIARGLLAGAGIDEELAAELGAVASDVDLGGKPLAAAHAALPLPADPVGRLWHAATVLRELHGDAHVAVLVANGVDGCAANVWAVACGLAPAHQRETRGWSEEQWSTAYDDLRARGWVDDRGTATTAGREARETVEAATHAAADAALGANGRRAAAALTSGLVTVARRLEESGPLFYPNPTSVARP